MLIYYSPDGQAIYIVGSGQASSAIGGLHDVSDLSRCPILTVTCPHGPQSGSELASKLRVGYSSNMHEASLSAGLPLHRWVLARRPCPLPQLAVMSPCGGQRMRGRLQNIADDGVVMYAPACPDARHPYVITQCKRSAVARLLRHRVLPPLHPYYPSARR